MELIYCFLEDGKDGDVFVTVDDCNGCTWDGEKEINLHPEDGVVYVVDD